MSKQSRDRGLLVLLEAHSASKESDDPGRCIERLHTFCRKVAADGWCANDIAVAAAVGAHALYPEVLGWLQTFSRNEIQTRLAKFVPVTDPLFAIYNLTTRALEAIDRKAVAPAPERVAS